MITKYKHYFKSTNETKDVVIVLQTNDCGDDEHMIYTWSASGTNYTGVHTYAKKNQGDTLSVKSSLIAANNISVWDVWCDQYPDYRMEIEFVPVGVTEDDKLDSLREAISQEMQNAIEEAREDAQRAIEEAQANAAEAWREAQVALENAEYKISQSRQEIEDARKQLASLTDSEGRLNIDTDELLGRIVASGAYSDIKNKVVNDVSRTLDASIGLIEDKAKTIDTVNDTVTSLSRKIDSVEGLVGDFAEFVDVKNEGYVTMSSYMNAKEAEIVNKIGKVDSGSVVSAVEQKLTADGSEFKASVTDMITSGVTGVTQELNAMKGNISTALFGDKTVLDNEWDLNNKSITQLVADSESGFTSFKQSISGITSVVSGKNGNDAILSIGNNLSTNETFIEAMANNVQVKAENIIFESSVMEINGAGQLTINTPNLVIDKTGSISMSGVIKELPLTINDYNISSFLLKQKYRNILDLNLTNIYTNAIIIDCSKIKLDSLTMTNNATKIRLFLPFLCSIVDFDEEEVKLLELMLTRKLTIINNSPLDVEIYSLTKTTSTTPNGQEIPYYDYGIVCLPIKQYFMVEIECVKENVRDVLETQELQGTEISLSTFGDVFSDFYEKNSTAPPRPILTLDTTVIYWNGGIMTKPKRLQSTKNENLENIVYLKK